jgi:hypothetical protein
MSLFLRSLAFLACIPSGGALLLKVWGITSMMTGGLIFLACLPVFPLVHRWACSHDPSLARAFRVGCWGGLVGTLGYDIVRVPFHLWGVRVFAPIQAYGVWLLDAQQSSGWTDAVGWLYHFSNGVTFGLMYALVLGGRHWGWGVLWGLALETIVLSTPFARIFHLQGNTQAIAIAYFAHLAYGYPLGFMVAHWEDMDLRLSRMAGSVKLGGAALLLAFIFSGVPGDRSSSVPPQTLQVQGRRLIPTWVRLPSAGAVNLTNPGPLAVTVVQPSGKRELDLAAGQTAQWTFEQTGIYQCYVRTTGRSKSSFIIIEPVERFP